MNLSTRALTAAVAFGLSFPALAQPVQVVLSLKSRVPMQELADNVTDPASPRYGVFYSPEEIRSLAGPADSDYQSLLSSLKAKGFQIQKESPTHLWISATVDSAAAERAFSTKLQFTHGNRHALLSAPVIPAELGLVEHVEGLDNTQQFKPLFIRPAQASGTGQPGVLPAQIKTVYGMDSIYKAGVNGKGQDIAIATYMGFHIEDVQEYYTKVNLSPLPTVDQVTFNGTPDYDDGSAAETQLDAEFSGMIAPGAAVHVFASAENSDAGEEAIFTAILDDNRAKIANYSWGMCETSVTPDHKAAMDKVFARAVAQGVNIMVASGDSGSDGCQDGGSVADWPAAHPNVVAVGGTTLKITGSTGSETGWDGSGGGVSSLYDLPKWQANIGSSFKKRAFPDVAFNADPASGEAIWSHYNEDSAHWDQIGGTSMSAPQWAGFLALVNNARVAKGKATLPFLPTITYAAASSEMGQIFSDVTSGSNGTFSCGKGYDAVTGLGSMKGSAMHSYLVAQ